MHERNERAMERSALLRRREALVAMGVSLGALYGIERLWRPLEAQGAACLLTREATEGPYYLPLHLIRRDITGGKKGTPLALAFTVVNASSCRPIRNATVELWHTDAAGVYSGVEGNRGTFLRGGQKTDAKGKVRFDSIFPGWYRGRTPHIHMKVFVGGDEVHTGQVFFQPALARKVYSQGRYASRGQADTTNNSDGIYRQAGGTRAIVPLRSKGSSLSSGLTGSLMIGVNPS
jgi:protocatechuate 3,4-dioxygenase beta subunit